MIDPLDLPRTAVPRRTLMPYTANLTRQGLATLVHALMADYHRVRHTDGEEAAALGRLVERLDRALRDLGTTPLVTRGDQLRIQLALTHHLHTVRGAERERGAQLLGQLLR